MKFLAIALLGLIKEGNAAYDPTPMLTGTPTAPTGFPKYLTPSVSAPSLLG